MENVSEIPDRVKETLKLIPELRELVERYRYMNHCVVVGRGINYGNAFEFSLKLMETCYVIAERFSAADFLHGPSPSSNTISRRLSSCRRARLSTTCAN